MSSSWKTSKAFERHTMGKLVDATKPKKASSTRQHVPTARLSVDRRKQILRLSRREPDKRSPKTSKKSSELHHRLQESLKNQPPQKLREV
ncbi:hypothetical protein V6N13_116588 [Hibiscus sabdariffa]|uniref:Uncharacterized protein n=1 Tax=Hibiscus sabdariffa TaxID=183260 RepID=A0ABR2BJK0_9ROSI